jgi:3D (Asp-Asp-Asp) domain-containing protein
MENRIDNPEIIGAREFLSESLVKLSLAPLGFNGIDPRDLRMSNLLKFALGLLLACLLASCAEQPTSVKTASTVGPVGAHRIKKVRTTAYTHTERGGRRNALGKYLAGSRVMSAAADWSRYPVGTRFRIVDTNELFIIDDYGTALVGTNTIDLYKTSRLQMRRWGVRHVDIDILEWGSSEQSLQVLKPRTKHRQVRRMIAGLQKKGSASSSRLTLD